MNFLYVTIPTPNYKIRVLWLAPKVKIGWFRTLFISTGCGVTSFLNKLDIPPGSRLSTGGKWSLLAETTCLTFCHGRRGSQSSQTGGGFSSQITCWPLKFQKLEELSGTNLPGSHESQHFLLNFELWRQTQNIYDYLILVLWQQQHCAHHCRIK